MARVLVTGGSGTLGREVVSRLVAAGYQVRVMSRRSAPPPGNRDVEWAQANLETGVGVAAAVSGAEIILHAASSPFRHTYEVDVLGTQRLVEQARVAGVAHLVYISIVGIDRVPFGYYQHKLAAESLVQRGGIAWSILRATQFHTLIDRTLQSLVRLPVLPLPTDFLFQPVDPAEVAERLVMCVNGNPAGRLPEMGGPEVRRLGDLARTWLAANELSRRVLHLPLPGKVAAGFRRGFNTVPERTEGQVTWAEWIGHRYRSSRPSAGV